MTDVLPSLSSSSFTFPAHNFILIEKNEYKLAPNKKGIIEDECMSCECRFLPKAPNPRSQACGDLSGCINRMLMVECGPDCPSGVQCQNKRFQRQIYPKLEVVDTPGKGSGLVTHEDLRPGQFVMEYVGEVLTRSAFLKRSRKYSEEGASHFYFMTLNADEVIDASVKGNISRFMNHSCNPNCATQKWIVGRSMRIGLFALTAVMAGTELTFDYKFETFGDKAQTCRCGESNCKGIIGSVKKNSDSFSGDEFDLEEDESEISDDEPSDEEAMLRKQLKSKRTSSSLKKSSKSSEIDNSGRGGLEDPKEVPEMLQKILHTDDEHSVRRYLRIFQRTTSALCLRRFLQFHGLNILHALLGQYREKDDIILHLLRLADHLPIANKNAIQDSRLDTAVARLQGDGQQKSDITDYAAALLEKWSHLELEFKIPKSLPGSVSMGNDSTASSSGDASLNTLSPVGNQPRLVAELYSGFRISQPTQNPSSVGTTNANRSSQSYVQQNRGTRIYQQDASLNHHDIYYGKGAVLDKSFMNSTASPSLDPHGRKLPPNWQFAEESNGYIFYYNTITRKTQWQFPEDEIQDIDQMSSNSSCSKIIDAIDQARQAVLLADHEREQAVLSSTLMKEASSKLREQISQITVRYLSKYKGQLSSGHDFKKLARKLTHALLEKEEKSRKSSGRIDDAFVSDKAKKKMKIYLKEYLTKLGYIRPDSNHRHKSNTKTTTSCVKGKRGQIESSQVQQNDSSDSDSDDTTS